MTSRRTHDSFLALLGLIAIAVYVLACRPSFSPDGTKVAFPVIDTEAKQLSVLCYDLRTKATQEIFRKTLLPEIKEEKSPASRTEQPAAARTPNPAFGPADEEERLTAVVQWLADGKHVVVNDRSSISIVPVGVSGSIRTLQLGNEADPGMLASMPPPILEPYQYLTFKTFVLRVNLQTGDNLTIPNQEEWGLYGVFGGRIYYYAPLDMSGKDIELGTFDAGIQTRTPLFHIKKEDRGEMEGPMALSRDGTRCALLGEVDNAPQIRLFRGDKLERSLPIAEKQSGLTVGLAEWSPDGKTIYIAFRRKGDSDDHRFGILEVPVSGGSIREIPLFSSSVSDDDWPFLFQCVLSPDGRTAAMTSTCAGRKDIKPENHGLYLVDLGSPARKVTKVTVPFAPIPKQSLTRLAAHPMTHENGTAFLIAETLRTRIAAPSRRLASLKLVLFSEQVPEKK